MSVFGLFRLFCVLSLICGAMGGKPKYFIGSTIIGGTQNFTLNRPWSTETMTLISLKQYPFESKSRQRITVSLDKRSGFASVEVTGPTNNAAAIILTNSEKVPLTGESNVKVLYGSVMLMGLSKYEQINIRNCLDAISDRLKDCLPTELASDAEIAQVCKSCIWAYGVVTGKEVKYENEPFSQLPQKKAESRKVVTSSKPRDLIKHSPENVHSHEYPTKFSLLLDQINDFRDGKLDKTAPLYDALVRCHSIHPVRGEPISCGQILNLNDESITAPELRERKRSSCTTPIDTRPMRVKTHKSHQYQFSTLIPESDDVKLEPTKEREQAPATIHDDNHDRNLELVSISLQSQELVEHKINREELDDLLERFYG